MDAGPTTWAARSLLYGDPARPRRSPVEVAPDPRGRTRGDHRGRGPRPSRRETRTREEETWRRFREVALTEECCGTDPRDVDAGPPEETPYDRAGAPWQRPPTPAEGEDGPTWEVAPFTTEEGEARPRLREVARAERRGGTALVTRTRDRGSHCPRETPCRAGAPWKWPPTHE